MSAIDDLPPLRQVIAAHGLSARKSLGQNFILDLNLTAKIARLAAICRARCAGSRTRTRRPDPRLAGRGRAQGSGVEKDARCLPALAEIAAAYPGRLTVLNGDALQIDPLKHLTPPSPRRGQSAL